MKEIQLPCGLITIVDEEDYDYLLSYASWYSCPSHNGKRVQACLRGRKPKVTVYMHRVVAYRIFGQISRLHDVDHVNRDALDNRRSNIRLCSKSQNSYNTSKRNQKCTSYYKGVSLCKRSGKWHAQITFEKNKIFIGSFKSETDAAVAYNKYAEKLFGQFAYLNEVK